MHTVDLVNCICYIFTIINPQIYNDGGPSNGANYIMFIDTSVGKNAKRVVHNFGGVCTLSRCYTYLACGGGTYLLLCRPPGSVTAFLSTSCDTYMALLRIGAEWRNGRMAESRNGRMAERRNGGMTEWQNGRMAKWRNGGMAEWHNVRYKIVQYQDTESAQMPSWQSPSWLVDVLIID